MRNQPGRECEGYLHDEPNSYYVERGNRLCRRTGEGRTDDQWSLSPFALADGWLTGLRTLRGQANAATQH